jgi:hypothetical protein
MSSQTQSSQIQVKTSLGEVTIELVKVEKRYNIKPEDILNKVKEYMFDGENVHLYLHNTWGSCREWKSIVLNSDGSYIQDGEWINKSSRKNVHKYKVMNLKGFLEKYRGKELIIYVYESPSCNASKEFSFRVVVRIL